MTTIPIHPLCSIPSELGHRLPVQNLGPPARAERWYGSFGTDLFLHFLHFLLPFSLSLFLPHFSYIELHWFFSIE